MALLHAYSIASKFLSYPGAQIVMGGASTPSSTNRTRLVDGRQDKRWSSGALLAGAWNITVDSGGGAISLDGIALLNHTGIQGNITITGADDVAHTVNVVTYVNAAGLRAVNASYQWNSASKVSWRIAGVMASPGAFEIGELYSFSRTSLARAIVYGRSKGQQFFATQDESDVGRMTGHALSGKLARLGLVWEDLTETQKDEIMTMHEAVAGTAADLLWLQKAYDGSAEATPYPMQECYLGRFLEKQLDPIESDFGTWNAIRLTFREQTRGVGQ